MSTFAALFLAVSSSLSLPQGLLASLCYVESAHRPAVVHKDDGGSDSLGICQVQMRTARFMGFKGTTQELMNPATNIAYAGKYLSYQLRRYHGNVRRAVAAYNSGSSHSDGFNDYTRKVFARWHSTTN